MDFSEWEENVVKPSEPVNKNETAESPIASGEAGGPGLLRCRLRQDDWFARVVSPWTLADVAMLGVNSAA
jgi:hypothetical protein